MKYRTLGKSGLKVSELALGTMTFGWGADKATSQALFDRYREAGGNFFDTADLYAGGESESLLGEFVAQAGCRDSAVISTKFSFNAEAGNPNAGGNGRKNIRRALEGSLRRLRSDYVDVYLVHAWDRVTPVEEVMQTLNDLVREGKLLHIGFSDVPAWYAARAQTLAECRAWERLSVMQLEYSLIARNLEREHLPLMRETGMALMPWSPLASGFLSGKFRREGGQLIGSGRVADVQHSGNPVMEKVGKDPRNWEILDELLQVAQSWGRTPAETALAWVLGRPGVGSVLLGATRPEQLEANLAVADLSLPAELADRLNRVSQPVPTELELFFGETMQGMIHGGVSIEAWH